MIKNPPKINLCFTYHFKNRQNDRSVSNNEIIITLSKVTKSIVENAFVDQDLVIINKDLNHSIILKTYVNSENLFDVHLITVLNKVPIDYKTGLYKFYNYSKIICV